MKPTYYGINAVLKRLEASPVFTWKIYQEKPTFNDSGKIIKGNLLYDAHHVNNKEESAEVFQNWAELLINTPAEGNTYFMVISEPEAGEIKPGRKPKAEPQQVIFTLYGGQIGEAAPASFVGNGFPAGGSTSTTNAPAEYYELLKRVSILEAENTNLKSSIINDAEDLEDLEEVEDLEDLEDDEEEEEKENPFTSFFSGVVNAAPEVQTPMQKAVSDIISGFAAKLVQSKSPEAEALEQIKATAPDAGKLLVILGQKAKEDPAQIKEFVNQLLTTFNNGQKDSN
jgi:hypothetical protein